MAGQHHVITVDVAAGEWTLLGEVAAALATARWTLVGGTMVRVHALRARIEPTRYTADVDVLIHIDARVSEVAAPLLSAGFSAQIPSGAGPFHRFRRGPDVVDVMVPATAGVMRWGGRCVLRAPGASRAQRRRDLCTLRCTSAPPVTFGIPDILEAIVMKAAAYCADSRDAGRHLEDLVVLLAAADPHEIDRAKLSGRERGHLRPAFARLRDEFARPWAQVSMSDRAFARASFLRLSEVVEHPTGRATTEQRDVGGRS